jgi:hypothetical protein
MPNPVVCEKSECFHIPWLSNCLFLRNSFNIYYDKFVWLPPTPYASRTRVHLIVLKRRKEKNKTPTTGRRHSSSVMSTILLWPKGIIFCCVYCLFLIIWKWYLRMMNASLTNDVANMYMRWFTWGYLTIASGCRKASAVAENAIKQDLISSRNCNWLFTGLANLTMKRLMYKVRKQSSFKCQWAYSSVWKHQMVRWRLLG